MSDLLNSPEMKKIKDTGKLVGDREVTGLLFAKLLSEEYESGVVVDGFPRTKVQVETVKMLHNKMLELRREFRGTPHAPFFRRPQFRITVLFVDEATSVERQLYRGRQIEANNKKVDESGIGEKEALRPTDLDQSWPRIAIAPLRSRPTKPWPASKSSSTITSSTPRRPSTRSSRTSRASSSTKAHWNWARRPLTPSMGFPWRRKSPCTPARNW